MKAKKLAEVLLKNPEAKVTLSVSNENLHFFADEIIEVTTQGEKQLTIVADINKNDFIHSVSGAKRKVYDHNWEIVETAPHGIKWKHTKTGRTEWE